MSEVTDETYVPKHTNADPEHDASYPPYVITLEQMRRWDTCEELVESCSVLRCGPALLTLEQAAAIRNDLDGYQRRRMAEIEAESSARG